MSHNTNCLLASLTLILVAHPLSAQQKPAVLYSLPADGVWAEFTMKRTGPRDLPASTGMLRISSVGTKIVNGLAHRWIQIKGDYEISDREFTFVTKLLLAEKAVGRGELLPDSVPEAYGAFTRKGEPQKTGRMSNKEIEQLLSQGTPKTGQSRLAADMEEITTPIGKFMAKRLSITYSDPSNPKMEACFWLTKDVPFGWAKYELKQDGKTVFLYELAKTGTGAKSELDESTIEP